MPVHAAVGTTHSGVLNKITGYGTSNMEGMEAPA